MFYIIKIGFFNIWKTVIQYLHPVFMGMYYALNTMLMKGNQRQQNSGQHHEQLTALLKSLSKLSSDSRSPSPVLYN